VGQGRPGRPALQRLAGERDGLLGRAAGRGDLRARGDRRSHLAAHRCPGPLRGGVAQSDPGRARARPLHHQHGEQRPPEPARPVPHPALGPGRAAAHPPGRGLPPLGNRTRRRSGRGHLRPWRAHRRGSGGRLGAALGAEAVRRADLPGVPDVGDRRGQDALQPDRGPPGTGTGARRRHAAQAARALEGMVEPACGVGGTAAGAPAVGRNEAERTAHRHEPRVRHPPAARAVPGQRPGLRPAGAAPAPGRAFGRRHPALAPGRDHGGRGLRPAHGQPDRPGGTHRRVRPHPGQGRAEGRHPHAGGAPVGCGRARRPDLQAVWALAAVPGIARLRGPARDAAAGPGAAPGPRRAPPCPGARG
jgi:hypothetical protein